MRPCLILLVALAGCGPGASGPSAGAYDRIFCRVGGARQFERFCTVERAEGPRGATLTIRKPDGGFRRLLVREDGRGVAAADGAERAEVTILDADTIEVAIGGDSFRLPATVRAP